MPATKTKTSKKTAAKKAPKKSTKPAPKAKAKAKGAVKANPKAAAPSKRTRLYARGTSPFSSPMVGDVVRGDGETREVRATYYESVENGNPRLEAVKYESDNGGVRTVKRESWSQWCSRSKAELVSRRTVANIEGVYPATPTDTPTESLAADPVTAPEPYATPMPEPDVHQAENLAAHLKAEEERKNNIPR